MLVNTPVVPMSYKPDVDTRTPNQVRFDKMIELNRQQLEHLSVLNKNMATVSNALFKLLEANQQQVKKAVDKPVKVK